MRMRTTADAEASASSSAARADVAKLAGSRSWQAWSGRVAGSPGYKSGDLWAGVRKKFQAARADLRGFAAPEQCPICFDKPEDRHDWHRFWCECIACGDCTRGWVQSRLGDAGPAVSMPLVARTASFVENLLALPCPVCSAPLRQRDAVEVLTRDPALFQRYDELLRDSVLRGAADYRPCPREGCTSGGFVEWECMQEATRARRWRAGAAGLALC